MRDHLPLFAPPVTEALSSAKVTTRALSLTKWPALVSVMQPSVKQAACTATLALLTHCAGGAPEAFPKLFGPLLAQLAPGTHEHGTSEPSWRAVAGMLELFAAQVRAIVFQC